MTKLATVPTPTPPKRTLSEVIEESTGDEPDLVLLYGPEGIGKTTWAAKAPKPVFICAENGTRKIRDRDGNPLKRLRPTGYAEARDFVRMLRKDQHEFHTLVIDTADWLEAMIWSFVCERDGKKSIEEYGFGKGYEVALDEWRLFISRLDKLREERKMGIIILAHYVQRTFKNPEGDDFDRYELAMHKKSGALLKQWADNVLFAHVETFVDTKKEGLKTKSIGISNNARIISTTRTAAWDAKNRDGLPEKLPLDYDDYLSAKSAGQPQPTGALTDEIETLLQHADAETVTKARELVTKAAGNSVSLSLILNRLRAKVQPKENDNV